MKTLRSLATVASLAAAMAVTPAYGDFIPGNLVVYRVGTGSGDLVATGNAVFLDEYTPTGTFVQSLPLPTTASGGSFPLIASGTADTEGMLTRSADGQYLLLTGYATTTGGSTSLPGSASATINRVVGRVDSHGVVNTTTALSDFADGNNPRSAVSTNGTDLWVGGAAGGVRYATLGAGTSTQLNSTVTNARQVMIAGGQLYVSISAGTPRVSAIGTGLAQTAGQTTTDLVLPSTLVKPDSFVFLDLSPGTPGLDTLYLADESHASKGLLKFCLSGGSWVYDGGQGDPTKLYRGLAATVQGTDVTLYSTREGGNCATGGGKLVSITDTSGFGGTMNGSFTTLATAPSKEAFRGVALAPIALVPEPSTLALLAAGCACLAGWRFGRRSRKSG